MLFDNSHTIPSREQDHFNWHRGRSEFGLWLIDLARGEAAERVEAARRHLAPFLFTPYHRQPHITLFVCGFPTEVPVYHDDLGAELLRSQTELLRRSGIRQFSIRIGGLNSFSSAPYLEVEDRTGGIERIRTLLSATGPEIGRQAEFVPHVTVGLYSGAFRTELLRRELAAFDSEPLSADIKKITFATYRAQEIAGALTGRSEIMLAA